MKEKLTSAGMERKYQDQLLQNYEFYKSAFELAKDPKLVLEDCNVIRFNPITLKFFDCDDPDKLFNHSFAEFLPQGIDNEYIKNNCAGNIFAEMELKTCMDRFITVSINFDTISRNGIERTIVTIHDISERVKTRKELEDSYEFINTLIEHLPIGIAVKSIKTLEPKFSNESFSKILGYSKEIATNLEKFIELAFPDPEAEKTMRKNILDELGEKKYTAGVGNHIDQDGKKRYIDYTMFLMEEQDNMVTMARNVTQEVKDKIWLDVKSKIVKTIPHPVMITDKEGSILWTNPAFYTTYEFSKEEIIGNTPRVIKSEKHDKEFYTQLWETISSGKVWKGEIINKKKDGTEIIDHQVICPIRADDKEITHYIAIKNLTNEELDYIVK
jgi:PAS domain S-box-containing protein